MSAANDNEKVPAKRRVPQQVRSRDRVQRILEVAGEIVVDKGVEGVTTRAIAAGAELPVASLYQYFADKEAVPLNEGVQEFVRAHNRRMARDLFHIARSAGMVVDGSDGLYAELAIEVADRIFQLAFESSLTGDAHLIDEGVALVTAYLETHATPAGIAGVPVR